jgi:general stress protein YciG
MPGRSVPWSAACRAEARRKASRRGKLAQASEGGEEIEKRGGTTVAKEDRGFASMDRARQREIASKGGKAAHQKGTAHEWTSEEARDAGRKGGIASHQRRREKQGGNEEGSTSGDEEPEEVLVEDR